MHVVEINERPEKDVSRGGPAEELVPINLSEADTSKQLLVGASLSPEGREELTKLLRRNVDLFAWSPVDMPGIDRGMIEHRLSLDPTHQPVKQKRRTFTPDREATVEEEVEKLLKARFIREIWYSDWLANVVMVRNSSGKWRMVMPVGLKNAGATYQRLVNRICKPMIRRNMEVYMDDMLVKSKRAPDHVTDLEEAFNILRRYNMKLNPIKCVFGVTIGKILGFLVSSKGIEANPDKIHAILEMTSPKTMKEVQKLTGRLAALVVLFPM
ncbi:uncharacterized protein LOC122089754 [Macadamia integrifolia]|uniref:uncharacterized protein LOC122089754 n=1 Tax=Macadamia integrifolia TaxID=60698 RepID=UPI001C500622|nr:uncharacterized protein LOC122089754 [Macadamia integrifolia]